MLDLTQLNASTFQAEKILLIVKHLEVAAQIGALMVPTISFLRIRIILIILKGLKLLRYSKKTYIKNKNNRRY